MEAIDQTTFSFSPAAGLAVSGMVGFLVFAVATDLTGEQLRRVARRPVAPAVGLIAQFCVLPAVAYVVGTQVAAPSTAVGLLLVACCPAGSLSNYLTGVANGNVATSISMTAVSTVVSAVVTPLLFAFWASLNPATAALLQSIDMDLKRLIVTLLIMLVIPVTSGMILRAKRPNLADRIRMPVRRLAMFTFAVVVALVLGSNLELLLGHSAGALAPVLTTFVMAVILGWWLSRASGLAAPERRAVALEVAFQNVALAIALALAFFPNLTGVVVTCTLWGVVHLVGGVSLAAAWKRIPLERPGAEPDRTRRPVTRSLQ